MDMVRIARIMTEPEKTSAGKNHLKRASEWEYCRTTYAAPPDVKEMKPKFCYGGDALFVNNNNNNKKRGTREVEFREHDEMRNGSDFDEKRVGLDKGKKVAKPVGIIMAGSGDEEEEEKRAGIITGRVGSCASHGSISVIGRRRTMEDAVTAAVRVRVGDFERYDFFGVYDGHGGARVANACRDRLHELVVKEVEKGKYLGEGKGLGYWKKVMGVCFKKMDEGLMSGGGENWEDEEAMDRAEKTMGSTAAVALVGEEELVVANCGDSRVVLCRGGVATALSNDHKPDRPDERERVEAAGGKVIDWYGSRVLGVLGTSRSIGDQYLKPFVSSEPEVTVIERSGSDEFLVIASDGLWDVVSNELACDIVAKCFDGHIKKRKFFGEFGGRTAAEAAALLAELAMARGSKDNISVIVVELNNSSK